MRIRLSLFLLAAALCGVPSLAPAGTIVTTDEAYFRSRLAPGFVTEGFDNIPGPFGAGLSLGIAEFHDGPYVFNIDAPPNHVWVGGRPEDRVIWAYHATDPLLVQFTGGSPNAIGGYFFLSNSGDPDDVIPSLSLGVVINDGTFADVRPTQSANPRNFIGFLSDRPITTLQVIAHGVQPGFGDQRFATANDLLIGIQKLDASPVGGPAGSPAPEPSTIVTATLAAIASIATIARERRRGRVLI